jgi:hypothetical protein
VFNRVLNFRLTPGNGTVTPAQIATVPDGKVWKIESYDRDGAGSINIGFEIQNPEYGSTITFGSYSTTPIWLQEGTILKANSDGIFFSVLEFDVVPVSTTSTGSGGLSSEGLEFNQVINYSNNVIVGGYGEIIDVLEVPQGKVWKITRVTILGRGGGTSPGAQYRPYDADQISIELGGVNLFYRPASSGYSNSSFENYPVWINSGTKDLVVGKYDTASSSFRITLSAIEYNIPQ